MRIGICDDEQEVRELIAEKVQKQYPAEEVKVYPSGKEVLEETQIPDILFLDIQMPELNGMELARRMRKNRQQTIIIFVTAIEDYVFEAFDVGAFHYLVKPFSNHKFEEVLKKAVEQYKRKEHLEERKGEKSFFVKSCGSHIRVDVDDIMFAEVFNRKIILHKIDGEIEYYGKMSELQKQTGESFFRSHRAYLVNFKYVTKYNATTIYLEKGQALMAKKNYAEFVKSYLKYNQREKEK